MPGLEDLYREIILDHYRNPRNRGELETPPATMAEGFNPLCGDEIKVYLMVENGLVTDIKVNGVGCSVSQSSASMMTQAVKGKTLEQARDVIHSFKSMFSAHDDGHDGDAHDHSAELAKLGDLQALQGVVKFPARIKCATLAWNTLTQALDEPE